MIDEIYKLADEQGWDVELLLEYCFSFIEVKGEEEDFISFLNAKAYDEEEDNLIEKTLPWA